MSFLCIFLILLYINKIITTKTTSIIVSPITFSFEINYNKGGEIPFLNGYFNNNSNIKILSYNITNNQDKFDEYKLYSFQLSSFNIIKIKEYINNNVYAFEYIEVSLVNDFFFDIILNKYISNGICYEDKFFFPIKFTIDEKCDFPYMFYSNDSLNSIFMLPSNNFLNTKLYYDSLDNKIKFSKRKEILNKSDLKGMSYEYLIIINSKPIFENGFSTISKIFTQKYEMNNKIYINSNTNFYNFLSYWTDFGSSFWYNYKKSMGYTRTLKEMITFYKRSNLDIKLLQIDSWWYLKGNFSNYSWEDYKGGVYKFEFNSTMFPQQFDSIRNEIGREKKLIVHSKWIDKNGFLYKNYKMSNQVSIDHSFWDSLMYNFSQNGVEIYEQDWLNQNASADLTSLFDSYIFTDLMSEYANKYNISIQYCMPTSKYVFQSMIYRNVNSIRVSMDGLTRETWTDFIFGSRLAWALNIPSFSDNVFSSDEMSLLLAVLINSPVGIGDSFDELYDEYYNFDYCNKYCHLGNNLNLKKVVNSYNQKIIKIDRVLYPVDKSYIDYLSYDQSSNYTYSNKKLILSKGYSYILNSSTISLIYIFAFFESKDKTDLNETYITVNDLEINAELNGRNYIIYDYFNKKIIDDHNNIKVSYNGCYYLIAPSLNDKNIFIIGNIDYYIPQSDETIRVISSLNRYFIRKRFNKDVNLNYNSNLLIYRKENNHVKQLYLKIKRNYLNNIIYKHFEKRIFKETLKGYEYIIIE